MRHALTGFILLLMGAAAAWAVNPDEILDDPVLERMIFIALHLGPLLPAETSNKPVGIDYRTAGW